MQPEPNQKRPGMVASAEAQFREALNRVGTGLEKNANWFLNFFRLDLVSLSPESQVLLWHDLLTLAMLASRPDASKAGTPLTKAEQSVWRYLEALPLERNTNTGSIARSDDYEGWWQWIVDLQMQVQEAIEGALHGDYIPLRLSDVNLQVSPHGLVPVFPLDMFTKNRERGSGIRGADGAVLIRLAWVLQRCGSNIRCCPACNTIFLATRKDQRFCTSNCRSRVGMQRWRTERGSPTKGRPTSQKSNRKHKSTHTSSSKGEGHGTKRR